MNSTMATSMSLKFLSTYSILVILSLSCISANDDRKLHIVYMGSLPKGKYSPSSHHLSLLQSVVETSYGENLLVRTYKRSFNGFAARLSNDEAEKLASKKEVVSVFPSRTFHLQTTRSWDFMGFNETARRYPQIESDVIIGVLDTGIWPESESFDDSGFSSPPKKWRGKCSGGKNFTCNNKLIGARYYTSIGEVTARDDVGHGTHTASTAAGNNVNEASFYGLAEGIARGGVPSARIVAYKVCTSEGCNGADLLAAFDDAIADGVDIITISIGNSDPVSFDQDPIAIGSFHAMENKIITLHSAGNSGPTFQSATSLAPWIVSVAASSTDRRIIDKVVLGNGKNFTGNAINSFSLKGENFPLIYGTKVSTNCSEALASSCASGCLDSDLVKGKIVLCDSFDRKFEPLRAGALGAIVPNSEYPDVSFVVPYPLITLNQPDYLAVKSYYHSTKQPVGNILKSIELKDSEAPVIASFSSRGPNQIVPAIMKPDISAPGVDILAAYPPASPPSSYGADNRRVKFNIISGTSMSCPHVAGVAAYVKSFHPQWSPAAIKSAIMTTAFPMNASTSTGAEFAYGSGHINPSKAINPGLVYEAYKEDYIEMLCNVDGYDEDKIRLITGDNSTVCHRGGVKLLPKDLNYPSMTTGVRANTSFTYQFHRTVTNVGVASSTYKASISTGSELKIEVEPQVLSFKSINETKSFNVTVVSKGLPDQQIVSASLVWSDGVHSVRSPISIQTHVA